MPTSIFSDEWRECLVAHYTHVLRNNDQRTERTLRGVMLDVGFTEDDLSHIYITTTAHVDHLPADFTPDSHFVQSVAALAPEPQADLSEAPAEAPAVLSDPPADLPFVVDDVPFDDTADDSQELLALDESEIEDDLLDDELPDDEASDSPADPDTTQMSLF